MEQHSKFSPSRLKQYLACPASFYLANHPTLPAEAPNSAAEEGTRLHAAMAEILQEAKEGAAFIEDIPEFIEFKASKHPNLLLLNAAQTLKTIFTRNPPLNWKELHVEERVYPSDTIDCSGTCDLYYLGTENRIQVIDFKFGYTPVSAVDNPQLMMYAAGAIKQEQLLWDYIHCSLAIIQPAVPQGLKFDFMKAEYLRTWLIKTLATLKEIEASPNQEPRPSSENCKWCRGKSICEAYQKLAQENATQVFQAYEQLMNIANPISDEQAFQWLEKAEELEEYISAIKSYCKKQLKNGPKCGYKLVRSRGVRAWKPDIEKQLLDILETNYPNAEIEPFDTKLKTAPGLLKEYPWLSKDKDIAGLIEKAPGKTISIAAESDPREAYIENPFTGLEDEDTE